MMMGEIVYSMCALGSFSCAVVLIRGYRQSRTRLLLWSSLCFIGLTLNNTLLFFDLAVFPEIDFAGTFWRNALGATSGSLLLGGLIWELT